MARGSTCGRAPGFVAQTVPALLIAAVAGTAGCAAPNREARRPTIVDPAGDRAALDAAFRPDRESLAADDPQGFLQMCLDHCAAQITDYRCVFHMQERVGDRLPPEQVIDVAFRETPYSVDMRWIRNPAGASRVSFVAGRWVRRGRQLALIVPAGLGALFAPGGLKLDIHGPEVRAASPRRIDQFGFQKTLKRTLDVCEAAGATCDLRYVGRGRVDDRPCYVLERRLPYGGPRGPFPDRLSVIHIDAEWLTPISVQTYANDDRTVMLGSFITTDVRMNTGLSDEDFN